MTPRRLLVSTVALKVSLAVVRKSLVGRRKRLLHAKERHRVDEVCLLRRSQPLRRSKVTLLVERLPQWCRRERRFVESQRHSLERLWLLLDSKTLLVDSMMLSVDSMMLSVDKERLLLEREPVEPRSATALGRGTPRSVVVGASTLGGKVLQVHGVSRTAERGPSWGREEDREVAKRRGVPGQLEVRGQAFNAFYRKQYTEPSREPTTIRASCPPSRRRRSRRRRRRARSGRRRWSSSSRGAR